MTELRPWSAPGGTTYWLTVVVLGVLAAGGVLALALLAVGGPEPRVRWAYPAATLSFILSTAQAAPILALATRLTRGYWSAPLRRLAELGAVAGLVTAPLCILLLLQLPDWHHRPSIWLDWPGAPLLWDSLAVLLLAVLGMLLLHVAALPDFAAARDAGGGAGERAGARGLTRLRALGWRGTLSQWRVLSYGLTLLGACYLMLYTLVHLLVVSDLALSLVPHWNSAVIPPYHAISGVQGGVAATVLALGLVRRAAGPERVEASVFHACGVILQDLALICFWVVCSEFVTFWYGRLPHEQWLLGLLMFGPSLLPFLVAFGLCFLLPLVLLIWNPIRNSVRGPVVVAALTLVGLLADRVRIFGAAWSVAGPVLPHDAPLPPLPAFPLPGLLDLLVVVGMPATVVLLGLLVLRLLPPLALWELRTVDLLTVHEPLARTQVVVVGKPS